MSSKNDELQNRVLEIKNYRDKHNLLQELAEQLGDLKKSKWGLWNFLP